MNRAIDNEKKSRGFVVMVIQFKDFVGYPYEKGTTEEQASLTDATTVLNSWLEKNQKVQIVNIESIYKTQGQMMGSGDQKFKNLRVWYTVKSEVITNE